MSSRFRRLAGCVVAASALLAAGCDDGTPREPKTRKVLKVCADPNNLPFSNERREGFENVVAELVAGEMHADVEYVWWAQRRGFVRNTLRAGSCDVIVGMPTSLELALPTAPYYRSTYVFVSRTDRKLDIASLDDPRLRDLKIGVHIGGDDGEATPPGLALARRGLAQNMRGYPIYGDYSKPNPPARLVDAVAVGEVDVAVVWGPFAGYFAPREPQPLTIAPVTPEIDLPFLPMVYDISFGVRRSDPAMKERLERIVEKRRTDIDAILARYGVPRADREPRS